MTNHPEPSPAVQTATNRYKAILCLLVIAPVVVACVVAWFWAVSPGEQQKTALGSLGDFAAGMVGVFLSWLSLLAIFVSLRYNVLALNASTAAVAQSEKQVEIAREQLNYESIRHREENEVREKNQRQERVFLLLGTWTTADMLRTRTNAYQTVRMLRDSGENPFYIGEYRANRSDHWACVHSVNLFFSELNALLDAGLLDEELVARVLGYPVMEWFRCCENLDWGRSVNDKTAESIEYEKWFEDFVSPLGIWMEEWFS